jgi:hypothetical protein
LATYRTKKEARNIAVLQVVRGYTAAYQVGAGREDDILDTGQSLENGTFFNRVGKIAAH